MSDDWDDSSYGYDCTEGQKAIDPRDAEIADLRRALADKLLTCPSDGSSFNAAGVDEIRRQYRIEKQAHEMLRAERDALQAKLEKAERVLRLCLTEDYDVDDVVEYFSARDSGKAEG